LAIKETGDGIAGQIFRDRRSISLVLVVSVGFGMLEIPWRRGAADLSGRKDLVGVAERADAIVWRQRIAGRITKRGIGDRKAFRGAVKLGIRT
jgi:hypothetical protein